MVGAQLLNRWNRAVSERYPDLALLRKSIWRGTLSASNVSDNFPPRSLLWKVLLLYGTFDQKSWSSSQERDLRKYNAFLKDYESQLEGVKPTEPAAGHEPDIVDDPLSRIDVLNISSWAEAEDVPQSDLAEVIMQDVERTFPDMDFFRQPNVQRQLLNILYIYARQNPDIGYRQGMHELAGPVLWVVTHDYEGPDEAYIVSDSLALFEAIMKSAKPWYMPGPTKKSEDDMPPIVVKSKRIQNKILRLCDPELFTVLSANEIEPQIWGIRWIRLLFGREFDFANTLSLWDSLFAADGLTLDLVDYICVSMLIRVRGEILADPHYTSILTTLLNYPSDASEPSSTYVVNALYLKKNLNPQGGAYVVKQFESAKTSEGTPVMSPTTTSPVLGFANLPTTAFNLDSLKDAARSVTQRLDIDRRVRGAFERHVRSTSPTPGVPAVSQMEKTYQDRNDALADMLNDALTVFEKLESRISGADSTIALHQALDKVRHVRESLLEGIESTEAAVKPLDSERGPPVLLNATPRSDRENKAPTLSPTRVVSNTPIRASLANSDFAWMLDSPGPSPPDIRSNFKGRTLATPNLSADAQSPPKVTDIFEMR